MNKLINPIFKLKNVSQVLKGRIPAQLIIQYSDACNAKCPQCSMRVTEEFKRSKLAVNDVKNMIRAAAAQGVQAISITGGEPLLFKNDVLDLLKYASDLGIEYTRTGTNGFIFLNSEKEGYEEKITELVREMLNSDLRNLWISLDSSDVELHEKMRGLPGVVAGIKKALPIFHAHGMYPAANFCVNRTLGGEIENEPSVEDGAKYYDYYVETFRKFYNFALELGFTSVNACYPMSASPEELKPKGEDTKNNFLYGAVSSDRIVTFSAEEKRIIFKAMLDVIPEFRNKIRIFSPRASLYSMINHYDNTEKYSQPCHGGKDFFYVDCKDGNTYPCGYRSDENLGKFWSINLAKFNSRADCIKCDWECFRDPSELIGHLRNRIIHPIASISREISTSIKDKEYEKIWKEDISYYISCDFFSGRIAPNYKRLSKFELRQ